jgi:hypothetical protein
MKEDRLRARQHSSQRAFYRALAGGSPGARLLELPGVQATLAPVREWFSIFNSVLYEDPAALERHHGELVAAYADAGIGAWTVWVPPTDTATGSMLQSRGHHLDSTPMPFAAEITSLDLDRVVALELEPEPTWQRVAEINDRAHGVLQALEHGGRVPIHERSGKPPARRLPRRSTRLGAHRARARRGLLLLVRRHRPRGPRAMGSPAN